MLEHAGRRVALPEDSYTYITVLILLASGEGIQRECCGCKQTAQHAPHFSNSKLEPRISRKAAWHRPVGL